MTRAQYRQLCRFFVAQRFAIDLGVIQTLKTANPLRRGQARYRHRIDLHWISEDAIARYVHIAHTLWRTASPAGLAAVLHLQQVRHKLAAHKAVLITNTCFTRRAVAAAEDDGIALFLVRPAFDHTKLTTDRPRLLACQMRRLVPAEAALYTYEAVHRHDQHPV
ncbi:MAG TPA: hypothetical protein VGY66_32945 [Gemmataceae bacterium]|nr:hypothetical protein [Gemmataceae bacterium]